MSPTLRPYEGEEDYWRVRAFLRRQLVGSEMRPVVWHVVRWDYWRWHGVLNCGGPPPETSVTLVEAYGQIVGMVNAEDPGSAFLQLDPRWRQDAGEAAMLAAAEERLPRDGDLLVWVPRSDDRWANLLARSGYRRTDHDEHTRARRMTGPLPPPDVAAGYHLRALGEGDADFPERGEISLRVFHPVPDGSVAMTARGYRAIQRCPLYRRDLDLVAEAPDGSLAGFVTVWFDDATRTAVVEPMGTDAPHRRLGLARALLLEGLERARWLGATVAYVGSYGAEAGALYESVGLRTVEHLAGWRR